MVVNLSVVPSWFVVLPDCESASPADIALRRHAKREISHPSGRPWLLGRWAEGSVTVGRAGSAKIAVIGQHAITAAQLAEAAGRIRTVADADRLATSLVGSSHLVASVAGRVRLQGTITGLRRVFHARIGAGTVAADRADVLASLLDGTLDEQRLAVRLLDGPLSPLSDMPVWRAVEVLPTDHYLVLDGDGRQQSVKWWTAPEPVVPMSEGAPALREALSEAVDARVRAHELVSCDLGGLDSTSVCCLAARDEAKVVAYTVASPDPLFDDTHWATLTVARLGNVEHHIIPEERVPLVYRGVLARDDYFDEPCAVTAERERWFNIAREAAARGSRLHLTGFGGDELLYGSPAHLRSLLRTNPRIALRHLRGFAVKYRWSLKEAVRQLLDNRSYRTWFGGVADDLTAKPTPLGYPLLEWGIQPHMPPWATTAAVGAVRELIRAEARTTEPLAKERGQHRELVGMRHTSRIAGQMDQIVAQLGITLAHPYHDDRVVEAGLAVRPKERITPWQYKPLIIEAMRGIVPEASLARQTKAGFGAEEEIGLRENRAELLTLFEDSRLARLGLVDAKALREVCRRPLPPLMDVPFHKTVACEVWLRALEGAPALK